MKILTTKYHGLIVSLDEKLRKKKLFETAVTKVLL